MEELSGEIWVLNASVWASTPCLAWKVTCFNFTKQILVSGLSTAPVSWAQVGGGGSHLQEAEEGRCPSSRPA